MQSQKRQNDLCSFPKQTIQYPVTQVYAPTSNAEEAEVEQFYEDLQDLLELTLKPGVTGKCGLGMRNEAGQRLRVLPRKCTGHSKNLLPNNTREDSTHGHYQMVNNENRLIIFFAAKDGEALYSQQKQDQELTVAQIMNSL